MKIICVGFWKTGTKSMAAALKLLGYQPVYDNEEQYLLLDQLWLRFFDGTITDDIIRSTLENIDVLIDGPTVVFWEEIYRVFPDAKIIMTSRDENCWWKSFKAMNDKLFKRRFWRFFLFLSPSGAKLGNYSNLIYSYAYGMDPFGTLDWNWNANARLYKLKYRIHKMHVVNTVPPENLLIHFCKDGWDPLCKFLGQPIPGIIPYPNRSMALTLFHKDTDANTLFKRVVRETVFSLCIVGLLVAVGIMFGVESGWLDASPLLEMLDMSSIM